MTHPLDTLSAALFAPLVGSAFALRGAEGTALAVTLARCEEHPRATMPGGPRTAFSLDLCCPAEGVPIFTGGSFLLWHETLGEIGPLYVERILPTGYGPGLAVFQIIFT